MNKSALLGFSRREFLTATSMLGAATLLGLPRRAAAEPPPETTRFRIAQGPFICYAPQMIAEDLLRMEGFTDIQYVKVPPNNTYTTLVASGGVDLAVFGPPSAVVTECVQARAGRCRNGAKIRFEVQEGVLRLIGQIFTARSAQAN